MRIGLDELAGELRKRLSPKTSGHFPGTDPVYLHVLDITFQAMAELLDVEAVGHPPNSVRRFIECVEKGEATGGYLPWQGDEFAEKCREFIDFTHRRAAMCLQCKESDQAMAYMDACRMLMEIVAAEGEIPDLPEMPQNLREYRRARGNG